MSAFLTISLIHFIVLISPGPDFVMVTRNSLLGSRSAGLCTALGISLGMIIHIAYSILGIGFVIAKSILLFNAIKYIGAGYLIFIGCKALFSQRAAPSDRQRSSARQISSGQAFRMGFLCNVLNPKATLFFLALFTQVISPTTPVWTQLLYGASMMTVTFVWFAFVASMLSLDAIKTRFERLMGACERVMGAVLIGLGIKIAMTEK